MWPCTLRHRLRNNTNKILYLREYIIGDPTWSSEKRLDPGITIDDFPANEYQDYNLYFCRTSKIVIFVGKYKAFGCLFPRDFITYFELIFEIDEGSNTLIVSGIRAQSKYVSLVKTLKHVREWPASVLWKCFTKREFGGDYNGRQREIVIINGFKVVKVKNKGNLRSGQQMMTIYVMINYDGEGKKNEEGGCTWSSGAHAKWEAISVDKNNLTLDAVADQICATLGLNAMETKLMFSHLPESCTPRPRYIKDSRVLNSYLTLLPTIFHTIPQLHVKMVHVKTNGDEACEEQK